MEITINGNERQVARDISLLELLDQMQINRQQVAVERNGELVPREAHADCVLAVGDRLEIVTLVGGG